MVAFIQSIIILGHEKPNLIVSAGGFVSVPLVWAAGLIKIPILIHQQDVRPGLANRLMATRAKVITTTFEKSLQDYGRKAVWIGNPIIDLGDYSRTSRELIAKYRLNNQLPLVLVVGGGTGAQGINDLIYSGLDQLTKFCQLVHVTGLKKSKQIKRKNYLAFAFLPYPEILALLAQADLVVSRCGLGFLTELSAFAKAAILIPLPHSHQEDNANFFKTREAAIVLNQLDLTADSLVREIKGGLNNPTLLKQLKNELSNG